MVLALLIGGLAAPARAATDDPAPGSLRVAHLSPDTPAVDVSLAPAAAPGTVLTDPGPTLVAGLRYGGLSHYRELPAGAYAVSIRAAGAPPGTPPVLSRRVDVPPGQARTVLIGGAFAELSLAPVDDDLGAPPPGAARVRVVAATTDGLDVALTGGPELATDLGAPGVGPYVTVPGGRYLARADGAGDTAVELPAGSVVTLLALDRPAGGVELRAVVDATGPAVRPVGGVAAGGGSRPAGGWLRGVRSALGTAPAHVAEAATWTEPVAVPVPVRVRVPAAGIDAAVTGAGLDAAGALVPPADPALAGWFTAGPRPGAAGPAVLTGHVDWAGRPGALAGLADAVPGDEVLVDRADGSVARFRVTGVAQHRKAAFPGTAVYAPTPGAELRLITCGGPFDRGDYRDNVVVSARLVG
ncbi:DUF4397 domain-containing protein [Blastococcus montanus]|uniref:DUF4397 domain-containing protein n=1 Tax=Blastococcus montanus TaxID=3144973 RepID=UPI00320AC777